MAVLIPKVLPHPLNPEALGIGNAVEERDDQIIDETLKGMRARVNLNPKTAASVGADMKVPLGYPQSLSNRGASSA